MSSLSVIIITKNEEKNITQCLKSVNFADEIIVLDSGSTDNTLNLCRAFTDKVFEVDWPGFGAQKNRALAKCTSEWVLAIDGDEWLSPELADEIKALLKNSPQHCAYSIPRKSSYCHQYIKFGDWSRDYCLRLFKRGEATFKEQPIHESLLVTGILGNLKNCILHEPFTTLDEVLSKLNSYSTLGASHANSQGKKSSLRKAIIHGLWTFIRGYILRAGFLDGKRGFMLAFSNAEGCYYRYAKILLQNETQE